MIEAMRPYIERLVRMLFGGPDLPLWQRGVLTVLKLVAGLALALIAIDTTARFVGEVTLWLNIDFPRPAFNKSPFYDCYAATPVYFLHNAVFLISSLLLARAVLNSRSLLRQGWLLFLSLVCFDLFFITVGASLVFAPGYSTEEYVHAVCGLFR